MLVFCSVDTTALKYGENEYQNQVYTTNWLVLV